MYENLKKSVNFDFKDSYDMTDKIEEELIQIEENSHKYASDKFMEILNKAKAEKEPVNVSSVGENLFYHSIHFLKGRGWTEEVLMDAVRDHYYRYETKVEEEEEPEPEPEPQNKTAK